ncbi:ComEC/Rec2 family competence protein [Micrococcus sp. KRD070]|uniref:ComEC/Rec2 family competence protein n=1 Tax=Micrococcus sp. KRD070 TaxID=2729719 RepID=UPI0019D0E78A|nr:ComEC/Rec2 family competence protein [Micrococcus sp. KRD070]
MDRRARHREVPGPLEARWVPALLACLTLGILGVAWDAPARSAAALTGLAVAAAAVLGAARSTGRIRGVATATALAGVAAALMLQHSAGPAAAASASGWTGAVHAGSPLRLELTLDGPATRSEATFGPRWSVPVRVETFGHPPRAPEAAVTARLTGGGAPPATIAAPSDGTAAPGGGPGSRVCVVARPSRSGSTVFLAAAAAPQPGPCPGGVETAGGATDGGPGPPRREALRAAFRQSAERTVGAAPELIPGLVLGDRSAQGAALDDAMKASGLSHLSAVSGANVAMILGAVAITLRCARVHRAVVLSAGLAVLGVFVVVVGPEPSVLRAAVMGALGALAVFFGRARQAFGLLTVGGTALLVAVPALAVEPAFHLSLAATAGIVLGGAPLDRALHAGLGRVLPDVVARWLSASLAVTVAAHLACQPIILAMTGEVSAYAVPANLLAAPAVPPVTVLGTLAAALALPAPGIAAALVAVIQWPAAWIGWVAHTSASLPGALRPWPAGALGAGLGVLLVAATLLGFAAVLLLERRRAAPVRRVGRSAPRTRERLPALVVLAAALAAATTGAVGAVLVPRASGAAPPDWAVAFCDVGQGDMAVFRSGPRAGVVVDVGPEPGLARRCLDDLDVDRVDAVLLTHLHADHAGGLAGVVDRASPGAVHYATRDAPGQGRGQGRAAHRQESERLPRAAEEHREGAEGAHHGRPEHGRLRPHHDGAPEITAHTVRPPSSVRTGP